MKHNAKVIGLLAVMMLLVLALSGYLENSPAAAAMDATFDVDGVWGIPEQGNDKQGANFDRWASGPGDSPTTIITIEGKKYSLEIVGFADCNAPGFPNKILYTHEMASDKADLYAWLVPLR